MIGVSFNFKRYTKGKRKKKFFLRNAQYVARNILGDFLVLKKRKKYLIGRIVETESYLGIGDDAAHSFSGKKTARTEVMYESGGIIYVYLIYGLYWCFNIVVASKANPQCVLIRALEPIEGIDYMAKKRKKNIKNLTNGPCRWTEAFGVDGKFLGKKITADDFFILQKKRRNFDIKETTRVGIDYATESKDLALRYYIQGNKFVSKK
ncbi:MAG: DNA-3-methyladenine glycosylase [Candidatus Omnitrophica bacterium]|nr:DNA-3-methyladenine glycosylase [Candidatus Omnitrophota bacterium]